LRETAVIEVTINGDRRRVEPGQTLAQLLCGLRLEPRMVVVERNGEIVARGRLAETPLDDGDTLEIVQMMAGG
jgi:thiamine biosynthesis protein ThiS